VGSVLTLVIALVVGAYGLWHLWQRLRREQRESIDIDAVIDAKYPNRAKRDSWLEREDGDRTGDISDLSSGFDDADGGADTFPDDAADTEGDGALEPTEDDDEAAARLTRSHRAETAPVDAPEDTPVAPARLVPARAPRPLGPQDPLPGEPDTDGFLVAPRSNGTDPAIDPDADTEDDTEREGLVGDPYEMLRSKRDRVAMQVAEAFREVHNLRTESLRRASQAEHNASLAASARTRAGRMVRDSRAVEAQGRRRPDEVPTADDAFDDVHRFRTAALKRAQQAEHGAQHVSQARERASRLLAEQRDIEAEMARLQRLRAFSRSR
jgi:hypothetical protein